MWSCLCLTCCAVGQGILLSASLMCHNNQCFPLWQKQLILLPTVELSVSFPTYRVSIILTFAVSTGLVLFP